MMVREFARELILILCLLAKIFWPEMDVVTGKRRRLHNVELYDLYSLPDIIRVIKLRRTRCAVYGTRVGVRRDAYRSLVGRPAGKRLLGKPSRELRILKWIFKKWDGGLDWISLAQDRGR
jgi:hypothetical protein